MTQHPLRDSRKAGVAARRRIIDEAQKSGNAVDIQAAADHSVALQLEGWM